MSCGESVNEPTAKNKTECRFCFVLRSERQMEPFDWLAELVFWKPVKGALSIRIESVFSAAVLQVFLEEVANGMETFNPVG